MTTRIHLPLLMVSLVAGAAITPLAGQQSPCTDAMTISACMNANRLAALVRDKPKQAEAETAGKPAGEANAAGLTPTIDDFLPRLSAALIAPGLDTSLVGRLATNQSLNSELTGYLPVTVRLGAELRRPSVYAAMLDSIPEARRTAVRDRFQQDLSEIDDLELTTALNAETRWRGRRYESHRQELERVVGNPADRIADAFNRLLFQLDPTVVRNEPGCRPIPVNLALVTIGCLTANGRAVLDSTIETLAAEIGAFETGYRQWAESTGWKYVPDLLNNQPQLSLQATWRPRPNDVVGPEAWSLRGRWERGWVNLNAVRSFCQRRVMDPATRERGYRDGQFHPGCFADYLKSERTQRRLRMGLRAFLQADLARHHRFRAPFLETDTANFRLPNLFVLSVSGGFGGYLPTGSTIQGSRFDFGADVTWAEKDDPLRPVRRTLLSLTLTQRLNQNFSLLSGLVWSDRDEFKDENVQRVRVNLGVRYKLVPAAK